MALARAIFETIMFMVGGAGGVAVSCCCWDSTLSCGAADTCDTGEEAVEPRGSRGKEAPAPGPRGPRGTGHGHVAGAEQGAEQGRVRSLHHWCLHVRGLGRTVTTGHWARRPLEAGHWARQHHTATNLCSIRPAPPSPFIHCHHYHHHHYSQLSHSTTFTPLTIYPQL